MTDSAGRAIRLKLDIARARALGRYAFAGVLETIIKGGPGSGNWAHTSHGRKGKGRGGSDPGGGKAALGGIYRGSKWGGAAIKWTPDLNAEARAEPDGTILVSPKFFDLDSGAKVAVMTHEVGHVLEQDVNPLTPSIIWDKDSPLRDSKGNFLYDQYNAHEATAEVLMMRALYPGQLRSDSFKAYKWASGIYEKAGVSPRALADQMREVVPQLTPGPSSGRVKLYDFKRQRVEWGG